MGFHFLGILIPYYGLFIVIGIACAFLLGYFLCKKLKANIDDFIILFAYLVAFGFLGAKLLYLIVSFKNIDFHSVFTNMSAFNSIMNSGFVFYGGLVGGLCGLCFVKKIHKIDINLYIKILAPCISLAHAFGRIGCTLAGCCYGKVTTGKFFIEYSESIVAPNGVKLLPIQEIESASLFILSIILVILLLKNHACKTHIIYLEVYSILRFILEFFRGDIERGIFHRFSTSQFISLFLFLSTTIYVIVERQKQRNN